MSIASTASHRTRRSVIALGLMLALGMSAAEALAGPLRDGSMHHESNIDAVSHQSVPGSVHDHDGSLEPVTGATGDASRSEFAPPSGEPEHEHPGGDDHCTHVHGVATLATADAGPFSAVVLDAQTTVCAHHDDPAAASIPHPPKD